MVGHMRSILCVAVLLFAMTTAESVAQVASLSAAEQAALTELKGRRIHELQGHAELAEYMRLRAVERGGTLPDPAAEIAHFALKSIGQPYQRNAWISELAEADCVTFTERCIALGCTDHWLAARQLQHRLRYKGGSGQAADLNHEPILDWLPGNGWLFDDITEKLGAAVAEFDAYHAGRTARVSYVPKESLLEAGEHLRAGDILLVVADTANPPSDPAVRTRCVHMAIAYKDGEQTPMVEILHSYPPAASRWPLERLLRNRYVRGAKILRLKANARAIVATELSTLAARFHATVNQVDNEARLLKGEIGYLSPKQAPEAVVTIDGVEYGLIRIQPGVTLWSLFGRAYKGICSLPPNQEFMSRHPDLSAERYAGDAIYVPLRRAGDRSADPAPPRRNPIPHNSR